MEVYLKMDRPDKAEQQVKVSGSSSSSLRVGWGWCGAAVF